MTPLHRRTTIGVLFIVLGLVIIGAALYPVVYRVLPNVWILGLGVVVAILGGIILPSSGTGPALERLVVLAGPWIPRVPGLSRVGDPKPPAPPPGSEP